MWYIQKCFFTAYKNPHVEGLAVRGNEFMRYDGTVKIVKDEALLEKG